MNVLAQARPGPSNHESQNPRLLVLPKDAVSTLPPVGLVDDPADDSVVELDDPNLRVELAIPVETRAVVRVGRQGEQEKQGSESGREKGTSFHR
jgi:hypothetical protein